MIKLISNQLSKSGKTRELVFKVIEKSYLSNDNYARLIDRFTFLFGEIGVAVLANADLYYFETNEEWQNYRWAVSRIDSYFTYVDGGDSGDYNEIKILLRSEEDITFLILGL